MSRGVGVRGGGGGNHSHFRRKKKKGGMLKGFPFISSGGAKWRMSIFHREIFMSVLARGTVPGGSSSWRVHSGHHLLETGCGGQSHLSGT